MVIELHTSIGVRRKVVGYEPIKYHLERRCTALEKLTQEKVKEYKELYESMGYTVKKVYVYHNSKMT